MQQSTVGDEVVDSIPNKPTVRYYKAFLGDGGVRSECKLYWKGIRNVTSFFFWGGDSLSDAISIDFILMIHIKKKIVFSDLGSHSLKCPCLASVMLNPYHQSLICPQSRCLDETWDKSSVSTTYVLGSLITKW